MKMCLLLLETLRVYRFLIVLFDTITCRIAAHHFTNPAQFIYEVNRTLEDNGLFILIDNVSPENNEYDTFYNFIEKKRDPSHERALKKTEWITLLEKKWFANAVMSYF